MKTQVWITVPETRIRRRGQEPIVRPSCRALIEIDVDTLAVATKLGRMAYGNKSQRSMEIGGLVVATVRAVAPGAGS